MIRNLKNRHRSEGDVIAEQRESRNHVLYLVKKGIFFHAYDAGAYALFRVMHYRVKRKVRKNGLEVLAAGFPADKIGVVLEHIEEHGGQVLLVADDWVQFTGVNPTPDGIPVVDEDKPMSSRKMELTVLSQLRMYDLRHATPLDTMNFVARLKAFMDS
jgi:hypothetical protein